MEVHELLCIGLLLQHLLKMFLAVLRTIKSVFQPLLMNMIDLFTLPTLSYPLLSSFSRVQESGLFFPNI